MRAARRSLEVILTAALALAAVPAAAAPFTPGTLVVLRVGDGSAALTNAATPAFLDAFNTSGTLLATVPLPTAAGGGNHALTVSGNSTSEGALRRSVDGAYLTLGGYDAALGTSSVAGSAATTVARVVGRIAADGSIDTTTSLGSAYSAGNIRGVASFDGSAFWTTGSNTGVTYAVFGATTSTVVASSPVTNTRVPGIFANQLYVTSSASGIYGVASVAAGLPTLAATPASTITLLPGFPTSSGPSAYGFAFAGSSTLYVADSRTTAGIQKWTSNGTTWTLAYTLPVAIGATPSGAQAVAVDGSGPVNVLYATTTAGNLVSLTDTGAGATATLLATAAANTAFRGLDFAPAIPYATLTVQTTGTGSGSVTGVANPYAVGATANITAVPDAGSTFVGWAGCSSATSATIDVVMSGNQTCTARFDGPQPVAGTCGADAIAGLAAAAPTALCAAGTPSAVSGNGHPWAWTCAGSSGGADAACQAVIASFTVSFGADAHVTLGGSTSQTVDWGGSTTPVTATPDQGWFFENWTGDAGFTTTTANPLTVTGVASDLAISAHAGQDFTLRILHVNDTHARVTPHQWIIPAHAGVSGGFEQVGGAAYLATELLSLADAGALVIDAGDISEGNPIGDMNGNGTMTQFYALLSSKLKASRGRGLDAVVVGNHDVRDASYVANLVTLQGAGVPVISINVRNATTHQPYFAPYTVVTVNGLKVGIVGYTTSAAEVGASLSSTLEIASVDWKSADAGKVHLADVVNELRNVQGCKLVVLAAHVGNSALVDPAAPILVDDGSAKLPEVVVTGHWHTWAATAWQPESLHGKSIFTESGSYMKYVGELRVDTAGHYLSAEQHVIRDADLTPDPDVQSLLDGLVAQYDAAHPGHPVDEVLGYTADDLTLDNMMRWWSANEYPWNGNNTAGQWICDAMRWKAEQLFGQCDLAIETGGGVRADIRAGPVTYLQVYETFPWADDTFYRINMTGQEIVNFMTSQSMNAGFSAELDVTGFNGAATAVRFKGQPIDPKHVYTVAINNYMYAHPPAGWVWSDASPLTSPSLCRDGLVDYMRTFPDAAHAYHVGGDRYHLNGEFSGGYRAVVTMMNDADTKPAFEYAFVRLLSATPETLARRGSRQVPASLVKADGSIDEANPLSSTEVYRSYLGFKTGALIPGDIVEFWGKAGAYGGNPEFVDQEGIWADQIEFNIVDHDPSLAAPEPMASIGAFWDAAHANHYVTFLARKASAGAVVDQYGQVIKPWDVTGYAAMTLPGNVGDMLRLTGVVTMESFALRFRSATAVVTAEAYPVTLSVTSAMSALPAVVHGTSVELGVGVAGATASFFLAPTADTYVASGKPTSAYGSSTNLYLQSSSTSSYGDERAWLKFDLSTLPPGVAVTGAALQLWNWKSAGAALAVDACPVTDDGWTAAALSWSTQPALGSPVDTQTLAAGAVNTWYTWNVGAFVQSQWAGDKIASVALKPATEGAPGATAPSYAFDSVEYGSNAPALQVAVTDQPAQVDVYYRYSADGTTWGGWVLAGSAAQAPWSVHFAFPEGAGHYEFYSVATDGAGLAEVTPAVAQASTILASSPVSPSGDLNGDGVVDALDALKALRIAAGLETATPAQLQRGDVAPLVGGAPQPDGVIDTGDVVVILRRAAGLATW